MVFHIQIKPDHQYRVELRKIKEPVLEFNSGQMTMILPKAANQDEAVKKHIAWISKVHGNVLYSLQQAEERTLEKRKQADFRQLVWEYAEAYSHELGVDFYKIKFKKLDEKWASCDTRGNLTVNTLLKKLPDELIEFVIFHEIVHRLEMNHGKNFWKLIKQKYPDHKSIDMELFVYWLMVERIAK
ncbi:MAG: M48 family metallopeptidase [Thermoplasmata archaeon]|nr:M48 family metallopeptidase [Thermoplasmata archaeon]